MVCCVGVRWGRGAGCDLVFSNMYEPSSVWLSLAHLMLAHQVWLLEGRSLTLNLIISLNKGGEWAGPVALPMLGCSRTPFFPLSLLLLSLHLSLLFSLFFVLFCLCSGRGVNSKLKKIATCGISKQLSCCNLLDCVVTTLLAFWPWTHHSHLRHKDHAVC